MKGLLCYPAWRRLRPGEHGHSDEREGANGREISERSTDLGSKLRVRELKHKRPTSGVLFGDCMDSGTI